MAGRAYYNEVDSYAAQWIRNLIAAGHIMPGDVDERSIVDVRPSDLGGYERCHFFAGIGVWDYALNLAGWPVGRPVWTGSCPCQPFSAAGRQAGLADERHLWPAWFDLIRECGPDAVLGEQVEAAVRLGWLDAVFSDLEGQGYACGAVVLGAHSVGAPHRRHRLWFVADAHDKRPHWRGPRSAGRHELAHGGEAGSVVHPPVPRSHAPAHAGIPCKETGAAQECRRAQRRSAGSNGAHHPWADLEWLPCRDGKARPTQPGLQPLAHGAPARVGRLRAYGNAINAEAAAAFIGAVIDTLSPSSGPIPHGKRDGGGL